MENSKVKLGPWAEEKVARYFSKGTNSVIKNAKIIGVEIDLQVETRQELKLIEVKSIRPSQDQDIRISTDQINRLKRVAHYLSETQNKAVTLEVAFVTYPDGKIEMVPIE